MLKSIKAKRKSKEEGNRKSTNSIYNLWDKYEKEKEVEVEEQEVEEQEEVEEEEEEEEEKGYRAVKEKKRTNVHTTVQSLSLSLLVYTS
ncbi:hypothetical protein HZH68_004399 [Vespula germanica]|uniref:Uncharacterized protein n=1 Tax=Vespula germanica TaxID=30212 RepID=A0A834KNR0_VESGE|nr:hypothetical protein HZH68_004399 [Vespula germanica]